MGQVISYLFRWHHWAPSVFFELSPGAQRVVRALVENEIADRNEEAEAIG